MKIHKRIKQGTRRAFVHELGRGRRVVFRIPKELMEAYKELSRELKEPVHSLIRRALTVFRNDPKFFREFLSL